MNNRLIKSNDAGGGGGCTNTVDLYNPFPDGGGVALYQLNGDATDVSGNYDGTASNVTYGAGEFGQAGIFNGSSRIDLPYLGGITPTSDFTISCWVNAGNQGGGDNTIVTIWDNTNVELRVDASLSNTVRVVYYSGGFGAVNSSFTLTENEWTYLTVTYKVGIGFTFYKNLISSQLYSFTATLGTTAGTNKIGQYSGDTVNGYFNGSIDQVRIFNRALRPYEVEALYTEEYCTPTIVPSQHFNTVTYTGDGGVKSVTGVGFQPDFTWIKARSAAYNNVLVDSVRGSDGLYKRLYSNATNAEDSSSFDTVTAIGSDGFTVNSVGVGSYVNDNAVDYVSWNFKAGGAAVTNTDGTITSQVSANVEAGFSIVTFTGTGAAATVGHGLNDAPQMIITKTINNASTWVTYHSSLGNTKYVELNSTNAASTSSGVWNDTSPNDSVFTVGSGYGASNWLAYCFAEVEGFSNFGSYVGTGVGGITVTTGFEPAFIMIKGATNTGAWFIMDNKRSPENPRQLLLQPASSAAEENVGNAINFLENGFQILDTNDSRNGSGQTYIYMAFAADPTAVEPTLEDSFNTVLYTGTGTTNPRTDVGFQPDLTWVKGRSSADNHFLNDSVRGAGYTLYSNLTSQETLPSADAAISSFDSNGFTLSSSAGVNRSGSTYVAWNWKGAEIPAINSNGSIPSVVSANPAAGFSIVSLTIPSSGSPVTVGHGLGIEPKVVIVKTREKTGSWFVYTEMTGADKEAYLELTNAWGVDPNRWNNTSPTSDVFTLGTSWLSATYSGTAIAYCFAEVAGFSKFGSYTGNANVNGATVNLGFEPAFVMIKNTEGNNDWLIWDNKRDTVNPNDTILAPNLSREEVSVASVAIDFNPTGFQIKGLDGATNTGGNTYIYMAFANQF